MIKLGPDICGEFETASSREWLETNGIGGYASSSISGANTRRYHGLLVAATRPPLGRMVLLSKFEETVIIDDKRFDISANQYPGAIYPTGYKFLKDFRLDPFPRWTFEIDGVEIEKSVFMVYGENSVVCRWKTVGSEISNLKSEIEIRPLLAFRDFHHLRYEDSAFAHDYQVEENLVSISPDPEMPTLYFAHNAVAIERHAKWYHRFEYAIEQERGFDFSEDLFQPFRMRFDLSAEAVVIVSTEAQDAVFAPVFEKAEIRRRSNLVKTAGALDDLTASLVLAADQFIVKRGTGKTVIAGYHWFSDWGRDTMIALPGLTLSTGLPDVAKSILAEFSKHISDGMIPNRFPDAGETPEYNTVDATLWYFEAIRAYLEATDDYDLIRKTLYEKLVDIIDWHVRGTRYQIHVDTDGLLFAGEPGVQLTWMDAKVGDWVVTPRIGKPVEIQALWYNALCIMTHLAERFDDRQNQSEFSKMAQIASDSFNGQFWNADEECLFDVINGDEKDGSIRPNQIFAVSLRHSMLEPKRARSVVQKVDTELLTPVGLRSLSPTDAAYARVYIGSPLERDGSYHQGTVWGWLIGPFVEAYLKVHPNDAPVKARAAEIIDGFATHLSHAAVGQISEIFDADPPHLPRGCIAQAWSVAELLRISKLSREFANHE
ncbi:MAG TPA: amylo-alpha-1,6-glucosidase [Pyrinomonadaceae bacterium]|nr:amylo-alpha-1,6-glucosidase [Pyrinomonadaceae bacterium]